jgi:tetratricopeptide (TPR) repeat protein
MQGRRVFVPAAVGVLAVAALVVGIQRVRRPSAPAPPPQVLEMISGGALASSEPGPVSAEFRHEMAVLEDRLAKDPTDSEALLRSAVLLQDAHQPTAAADLYRRLLVIDPRNRQAWLDLANVAIEAGDTAGALAATEGLLAAYPEDPEGLWNLGAIEANRGRTQEARAAWGRAAEQTANPAIAGKAAEALEQIADAAER